MHFPERESKSEWEWAKEQGREREYNSQRGTVTVQSFLLPFSNLSGLGAQAHTHARSLLSYWAQNSNHVGSGSWCTALNHRVAGLAHKEFFIPNWSHFPWTFCSLVVHSTRVLILTPKATMAHCDRFKNSPSVTEARFPSQKQTQECATCISRCVWNPWDKLSWDRKWHRFKISTTELPSHTLLGSNWWYHFLTFMSSKIYS